MSIRAKFHCTNVSNSGHSTNGAAVKTSEQVTLHAVYGKEGTDNATWAKYTPSGSLSLTIDNPEAWGQFEVGEEYFIDVTPAK